MSAELKPVNVLPEREQLPVVHTPMAMLQAAVERGATIEILEKLMGLSERYEANQARKAFDEAIAAAKAEIPPIVRNAKGHNDKMYADFSAIATVVDPIIARHGLSYRFRTNQGDRISVTCVLSHKAGHSEETTLTGPADTSGNKNAIQAIGSTLTYLQRYSLVQMLGLAAARDDDGKAGGGNVITDEQVETIKKLTEHFDSEAMAGLLKYVEADSIAGITPKQYDRAMYAIGMKKGQSQGAKK